MREKQGILNENWGWEKQHLKIHRDFQIENAALCGTGWGVIRDVRSTLFCSHLTPTAVAPVRQPLTHQREARHHKLAHRQVVL